MIGTDEPVVIEWKADDDFYEPLIGSQCQLNLWVTDDVTYDQFYLYDEREYSVKVYYESAPNVYTVYWNGWIANDVYSEAITTTPYQLSINANDGLGSLESYDSWFPPVGEANPTLWKFIHKNLLNIGLDFEIWISNDIRIYSESIWNNVFDDVTIYKEGVFQDNYIIQDAKRFCDLFYWHLTAKFIRHMAVGLLLMHQAMGINESFQAFRMDHYQVQEY